MSDADDLRALMEADRWKERVSAQRTHLPEIAELAALEGELRARLKELHDTEASLAPVRKTYDDVALSSQRLRDRASELDRRLSASTANARELTAIQTELDHVRALLAESEDRELELLLDVELFEAAIASIKAVAQPGVARRSELTSVIDELQATLADELAALGASRDEVAATVSPALRTRYEAALRRSGTSGAAQVVNGRCDGCRIALSPLDFDHWRLSPVDTFMDCPECGRLLLP